ncbi:hypothetical protein GQ44DRAFT_772714 [Phaeosphaeriaceae sp. PMI808]|nr:hypothetical protein GQ44DRAFT_772714 [Phaeosphaeriaceae sp. PMI808]
MPKYDDFAWVHIRSGENVHGAAPFLAWHRYFIHLFEVSLRHDCGYKGVLTYWDWGLDWEDITAAPIWAAEDGFGSNGHPSEGLEKAINGGYCVQDGPFRHFSVPYLDKSYWPHCLTRGFLTGDELKNKSQLLAPDVLEGLLDMEDYSSFNLGLENGPHNVIPQIELIDPDPVFFLHHTQLDRLWWTWQNRTPARKTMYTGFAAAMSNQTAVVTDLLLMGGLAPDIRVEQILDTQSGLLCYKY